MNTCRLCNANEADSNEHIVPDALGGKIEVPDFICTKCNNSLGNIIDSPLEKSMRPISVPLGCRRGDGSDVAPLRRIRTARDQSVDLHAGGRPVARAKDPVKVSVNDEGRREISILAADSDKAAELLAHQMRRFGLSAEKIASAEFEKISEPLGRVVLRPTFSLRTIARSLSKSALAALVRASGRTIVDGGCFDDATVFIKRDVGSDDRFAYLPGIRRDLREALRLDLGNHALLVQESPEGVEAVLVCFGVFPFWTRVSVEPIGIEGGIVHIVDPRRNAHVERRLDSPVPVSRSGASPDLAARNAAAEELSPLIKAELDDRWRADVAEEAVEALRGLPPGTALTDEHFRQIQRAVARRVWQRMTGKPITTRVDSAEIIRKALRILPTLDGDDGESD